jgi:S1-C subfamily serine protease
MIKIFQNISIFLFITTTAISQTFNGYKYINVPQLKYQDGGIDNFGISSNLRSSFSNMGMTVLPYEFDNWPQEAINDDCLVLNVLPSHKIGTIAVVDPYVVNIKFKNCNDEIIYSVEKTAFNGYRTTSGNLESALDKCLKEISAIPYYYYPSLTPQLDLPAVEETNEDEGTIKKYLSSNNLDALEGIYKSYQTNGMPYYKIGIIKKDDKYKAIIIESDLIHWKTGEVKAIFEQSSMKGFYSVKWYLGNKETFETFAKMDNEAILKIELNDQESGEKRQDTFIKMFPVLSSDVVDKKEIVKSSGSGFFLTKNGIIATNAHVIKGAKSIQVTVTNDIGSYSYNAIVLMNDDKNDVALLQISDDKFKGLAQIPYGIIENSEIGEKVFTIGYPLNDVMGNNYKVTDGIISSKTGINDDLRYYQISVPLQPGNSGGPLFNKEGNIIGITSARLNEAAVGTTIENVNYAVKSSYLLNLYKMLQTPPALTSSSTISSKELQNQVKILKNYVCLIKTF